MVSRLGAAASVAFSRCHIELVKLKRHIDRRIRAWRQRRRAGLLAISNCGEITSKGLVMDVGPHVKWEELCFGIVYACKSRIHSMTVACFQRQVITNILCRVNWAPKHRSSPDKSSLSHLEWMVTHCGAPMARTHSDKSNLAIDKYHM